MRKIALLCVLMLAALAGNVSAQTTVGGTATIGVSAASPINVGVAPTSATVATNSTQSFILTITNDAANAGANLALTCVGSCGTIDKTFARTGAMITFTAPSTANSAITLTATSAQDSTRFTFVPITVTATTPPAVVNFVNTPGQQAAASVNTFPITATVGNSVIVGVEAATADVISSVQVCPTTGGCVTATQACTPTAVCSGSTTPGGASYQYYAVAIVAGMTSVVVNNSSPSGTIDMYALDCSGLGSLDTASVASNQTTATTTPTGPSLTPATAGELLVAGISTTGTVNSVAAPYIFNAIPGGDGVAYTSSTAVQPYSPNYSSTSGTWSGFQGAYNLGTTPVIVRVNAAPTNANVQVTATQQFTATVTNDAAHAGVTWSLAGGSCSGAACGTLSSSSSGSGVSITYTAPATVPGASVSRIQHATTVISGSSGSLTISPSTAGDILCGIAVWNTASGTLGVTDPASQIYATAVATGAQSGVSAGMMCTPNTAAGVTSINFAITGASPTVLEVYGLEYAGIASVSPVDQATSAAGFVSPMDSGSMTTTTNANDVLIGFGFNGSSLTYTAGNDGQGDSYTLLNQQSAIGSAVEDFFTTGSTKAYKATLTPATAAGSRMFVVALKAGAAGSSNVTLTATSVTDGTKTAVATISIGAAAVLGVAVSPPSSSTTAGGSTVSVTPTVSNDPPNGGVTWTLTGVGTLSAASGPSGTPVIYTPPASVSSTQTVTVTATAVDDGTKSASSTITISSATTGGGGTGSATSVCNPACPAFAGPAGTAQGSAAGTAGGRGGKVYNINDLTDNTHSGCTTNSTTTCSLRDCVTDIANVGARYCVFQISGAISATSRLQATKPFMTILGQTAPGGPVTLHEVAAANCTSGDCGIIFTSTHDIIYRYLTYDGSANTKTGPDFGTVGMETTSGNISNVIFDHFSGRWWGNAMFDIFANDPSFVVKSTTVQWSLMYEPSHAHPIIIKSDTTQGNSATGTDRDYHHNVGINYARRWGLFNSGSTRWVNNLSYNGLDEDSEEDFYFVSWGALKVDLIGNKYVDGPQSLTPMHAFIFQSAQCLTPDKANNCPASGAGSNEGPPSIYLLNNISHICGTTQFSCTLRTLSTPTSGVNDSSETHQTFQGWEGGEATNGSIPIAPVPTSWYRSTPLPAEAFPITQDPVSNLDTVLLATVGNWGHLNPATCTGDFVNNRDSQDARVIAQYRNGGSGAGYGTHNPADVATQSYSPDYNGPLPPNPSPAIQPGTPCVQSMHDGIPDAWKNKYHLSTTDPNLYKTTDPVVGLPYIEVYADGLVP